MAPVWVKGCGLSERELPPQVCPSGILVLEVPGLAPGASANPFNSDVGYICFVRSLSNNQLKKKVAREHKKRSDAHKPAVTSTDRWLRTWYGGPLPFDLSWLD